MNVQRIDNNNMNYFHNKTPNSQNKLAAISAQCIKVLGYNARSIYNNFNKRATGYEWP